MKRDFAVRMSLGVVACVIVMMLFVALWGGASEVMVSWWWWAVMIGMDLSVDCEVVDVRYVSNGVVVKPKTKYES